MSEGMEPVDPTDPVERARPETPAEALEFLLEGNRRFVTDSEIHPNQSAGRRAALAPAQRPFAVLFGCSDSRLAAEIIFDRGLGDLFVVRTAGHVVGTEVLGSIEYAVTVLETPLVVVLGHDSCGAIAAALDVVRTGVAPNGFIRDVVERVLMSVLAVHDLSGAGACAAGDVDPDVAGVAHVRDTAGALLRRSVVIADRVADGRCGVVGLSYRLAEGTVRRECGYGV